MPRVSPVTTAAPLDSAHRGDYHLSARQVQLMPRLFEAAEERILNREMT